MLLARAGILVNLLALYLYCLLPMDSALDKNIVKEALRELLHEEPEVFKNLLKEILMEQTQLADDDFDQLVQKNFQRFDATFWALA